MLNDWYQKCFRRILVDIHIPDWNKTFLSKLDAEEFADTVLSGNPTSVMVYCNSHVGFAYYPSKVGPVFPGVAEHDFTGRVLERCHRKNVAVVAYYSAIFNNAVFLAHPEWRIKPMGGDDVYEKKRYGVCCPNSPYRDFAVSQIEEICRKYPFDGIFVDMLFWPHVCCCKYCEKRFEQKYGGEIPGTIDWNDRRWVGFQRMREEWMHEFTGLLTAAVRRSRPAMTVTHQMSPVLAPWSLGMPFSLIEHCDYASGDFYGPPIQQSVVCKIYESISTKKPFEFHTSRCVDLRDHVTMKSRFLMETQASLAPAHASAFMFIDAIDPVGTLNKGVYRQIAGIFSTLAPYEKFLGGDLAADVAIYVSSESRFNFREKGINLKRPDQEIASHDNMASFTLPHMDAVMGMAQSLQQAHIPFAIATRKNLDQLGSYKVLILPNVLVMSDQEIEAIRRFVAAGGSVYASGYSSLVDENGQYRTDFGLADILGVSYQGDMIPGISFFVPKTDDLLAVIDPQQQFIHSSGQMSIRATSAHTLANLALPYYPENEGTVLKPSFASIHSNPPAPATDQPALTFRTYGNSRICYAAGPLESEASPVNKRVSAYLIRKLLNGPASVEAEAPDFVEITVFHKKEEKKFNVSLIAFRDEQNRVPCDVKVTVRLGKGRRLVALRKLPGLEQHPFCEIEPDVVEWKAEQIEILTIFEVEYATD